MMTSTERVRLATVTRQAQGNHHNAESIICSPMQTVTPHALTVLVDPGYAPHQEGSMSDADKRNEWLWQVAANTKKDPEKWVDLFRVNPKLSQRTQRHLQITLKVKSF